MTSGSHDPNALLERFGRQLLVPGVDVARQAALSQRAVVVTTAGAALETILGADPLAVAAEVCLRALAGAGYGRLALVGAGAMEAPEGVAWRSGDGVAARTAAPPVAHLHLASRPYGASADVLITETSAGWATGEALDATVATLLFDVGAPLDALDAPAFGAMTARLLLEHDLQLKVLPAVMHLRWPDDGSEPTLQQRAPSEGGAQVADLAEAALPPGLLAELHATPTVFEAILSHVERDWPDEACGFVLRLDDGGLETVPSRNLQDRYHGVDPEAYPRTSRTAFKVDDRLLQRRLDAGASLALIYHSHCEAGAYFSAEDARAAAPDGEPIHPQASHLVVSVLGGVARAAALYAFDAATRRFAAETGSGQLPPASRRPEPGARP